MEFIEITVRNFEKIIGRKDIKYPQFFAMQNDILEHPDFFDITGDEFKAYVWIMGLASKLNNPTVRIYPAVFERRTAVPKNNIEVTIQKLKGKRWDVRDPYGTCTGPVQNPYGTCTESVRDLYVEENRIELNRIEGGEKSPPTFRDGYFYSKLSLATKNSIESLYSEEFLAMNMIEIEAYLKDDGWRFQNKIETFIPRNLASKAQRLSDQQKNQKSKGRPVEGFIGGGET